MVRPINEIEFIFAKMLRKNHEEISDSIYLSKCCLRTARFACKSAENTTTNVGAKAEIYQLMRNLAESGVAIVTISSDMEEILGESDRVAVMHEGAITGILIGTALLQVLQNLVNLIGMPSLLNFAVMGAVSSIGVIADQILRQRQAAKVVK